ncbi:unnamed protein product [Urochloa humidicola]
MRRPRRTRRTSGEHHHHHKQEELKHDPPALPTLPPELVLEIVDRCDPTTLIACAAASRLLRRHVLSPSFISRRRAASRGCFAPSSLLGLFYRHYDGEPAPRPPPFTPASAAASAVKTPFAPDVFDRYTPVESRGGLLVLRRSALFAEHAGLCVLDPVTGRRAFLPPPEVHQDQQSYALLLADDSGGAGDTGRLFRRLVVVDLSGLRFQRTVRTQSFSPDDDGGGGAWGPVTDALAPDDLASCEVARPSPVILGAVLHWLCTDNTRILTLDAGTAALGTVLLPPYYVWYLHYPCEPPPQLLAASAEGDLSLLVGERLVINVWVRRAGQWTRRAAVDVERMVGAERILPVIWPAVTLSMGIVCSTIRVMMQLEWAGERSGAVVAQVPGVGLLVIDMEKEEVVCTVVRSSSNVDVVPFRYCPYERDLLERLAVMAPL